MEESAGGAVTGSFSEEVVEAIKAHMNRDHPADSLLICQVLGGRPAASRAWVSSVDGGGMDFTVVVDDREVPVRLPWSEPVGERSAVRVELVRMVDQARRLAGLPPRSGDDHS